MDKPNDTQTTGFADIQQILDDAVENEDIGRHGAFWRNVTRDEFVAKVIFGCPILHTENGKFVGSKSQLVTVLRGPINDCNQTPRPRMPFGFGAVPAAKIQIISDWIDAQCPA
jgi:hypothetical protein